MVIDDVLMIVSSSHLPTPAIEEVTIFLLFVFYFINMTFRI